MVISIGGIFAFVQDVTHGRYFRDFDEYAFIPLSFRNIHVEEFLR